MLLCLLGKVISYLGLFIIQQTAHNGSIPIIFLHKEQKEEQEKSLQHRCFLVNFAEFSRTTFFRTSPIAVSEDKHDEIKLLHITSPLNKCYI